MCFISVIVPIYNNEKFVTQCLNSITQQTITDIEIICIDDGSTDSSVDCIKEIMVCDKRVKLIVKDHNQGAAVARNEGIEKASGKYVTFMDSDDYYPSRDTLEVLFKNAVDHNVNVCGGSMLVDSNNGKLKFTRECGFRFEVDGFMRFFDYQFDYGFTRFIYKRSFLLLNQISFSDLKDHEDPLFLVQVLSMCDKFYTISKPVYVYRACHKIRCWSEKTLVDFFIGIGMLLDTCIKNNYDKLKHRVISRLNGMEYFSAYKGVNITPRIRECFEDIVSKLTYDEKKEIDGLNDFIHGNSKVSIIIPVYNVQKYIRKCLDSVVNQTYSNLEIICVNDGSTDDSLQILNEYAKKDNRITIINKDNAGLSSARNAGLGVATGKFCYFIDSDDWIDANTINLLVCSVLFHNTDCVIHSVKNIPEDERTNFLASSTQNWFDRYKKKDGVYIVPLNLKQEVASVAWNKLYRMDIIKEFQCTFPEGLVNEDEAFLWTYMIHCKNYYYLDADLYYYLRRSDSIMAVRNSSEKVLDILKILETIYLTVKKHKNINEYSPILTDLYIGEVSDLFCRIPAIYKEQALVLIKHYYKHINKDLKIIIFYYSNKYKKLLKIISVLFNITNSGKYKVITIFGVKFKIKTKKLLRRLKIDENSFIEDIFSIKKVNTVKIITIFRMKFKIQSKDKTC